MKYVIKFFENGIRNDVFVTNDESDLDGYYKLFTDKKDSYLNKGYKIIKESLSSERLYYVLFNEDEMKSAVINMIKTIKC